MGIDSIFRGRPGSRVSAAWALQRVRDGALVVDVRHGGEWHDGHPIHAIHIPLDELQDRMFALPRERPVVVVCRNGIRSSVGARLLAREGYTAWSVRGGLAAWAAAGGPITADRPQDLTAPGDADPVKRGLRG